ncbi:MAG: hypothetical protein R2713_21270 [Ilumatobacteraceae bacterium]
MSMLRFPPPDERRRAGEHRARRRGRWCVSASAPTDLVIDVGGWFG